MHHAYYIFSIKQLCFLVKYNYSIFITLLYAPISVTRLPYIQFSKLLYVYQDVYDFDRYSLYAMIVFSITSRPGAPFVRRLFTHVSMLIAS